MRLHFGCRVLLIPALCAFIALGADASGKWRGHFTLTVPRGQTRTFTLELKVDGSRVNGTIADENDNDKVEIRDGGVDGEQVSFGVPTGAGDMPHFEFRGKVEAEIVTFTISGVDPGGTLRKLGEATAKRIK
jgi:hypothetical protein